MSAPPPPVDLRLDCRPGKEGHTLAFPYTIQNRGPGDAYVMDRLPNVHPSTGAVTPGPQAALVVQGPGDDVTVGVFIAPMPTDRRVAVPVIPLARYLPAGGALEGRLEIPVPLAETSPYFGDLPLRQYEMVEITGLVFCVGYWAAGISGLAALPLEDAPELFTVVTRNTVGSARQLAQRFPTRLLQLFRRTDEFPRGISGESGARPASGEAAAMRAGPTAF
ncbi:MAG TPA: hypothetical protein VMU81_19240 [Acetobacteraceae bacterium]|jgi:hypothetical protein|nr:hypothetical protein [Acetobacteraceae bacterium]